MSNYQIERQLDKIAEQLEELLAKGEITQQEYNDEMRELQREYQACAEEAAQEEYQSWYR